MEQSTMNVLKCSFFQIAVMSALVSSPVAAWADANVQLARTKQCLACHQIDTRRVGPAFTVIAERYAGSPGALQYLADTIRQGSRAKWGAIPMPAQPQVGPLDAIQLAGRILSSTGKSEPCIHTEL